MVDEPSALTVWETDNGAHAEVASIERDLEGVVVEVSKSSLRS